MELSKAPLMRLALFRLADDAYQFTWTHHHILLDGWSLPILFKEVFAFMKRSGKAPTCDLRRVVHIGTTSPGYSDRPDQSRGVLAWRA